MTLLYFTESRLEHPNETIADKVIEHPSVQKEIHAVECWILPTSK